MHQNKEKTTLCQTSVVCWISASLWCNAYNTIQHFSFRSGTQFSTKTRPNISLEARKLSRRRGFMKICAIICFIGTILQFSLFFFYALLDENIFHVPMLHLTMVCRIISNNNSILIIFINKELFQLKNVIISKYFMKPQSFPHYSGQSYILYFS